MRLPELAVPLRSGLDDGVPRALQPAPKAEELVRDGSADARHVHRAAAARARAVRGPRRYRPVPAAAGAAPLWGGRAAARYEGWVIEDTAAEGVEEEEEEEGCCCCNWRDGDCPARPASGRPPKMKSVRVAIPPRFKRSSG